MPDCKSPKCHERMKLELSKKATKDELGELRQCIGKKLTKKSVWLAFPIAVVFSGILIAAADSKYANRNDHDVCKQEQKEMKATLRHLSEDLRELKRIVKDSQAETQRDIKEILRHLRDKP